MADKTVTVKILGDAKGAVAAADSASKALGGITKGAALAGAALAAGLGGALVGLAKIGESFDASYDKIRLGTGATGDALKGLEDSFKNVATSVAGVNFDQVSTAIADLNTRTGATGPALEKLSAQFLQFSKVSGTDVSSNVANMTRVFGDWSIATDDQSGALDKVWRASQSTGAGVDALSQQVVQFGAPLRQLGFSFEDSLAMLGKWEKEGVNTELVLGGMKKALSTFAKEGQDAPTALRALTEEIKGIQDPTAATQRAIEVFGAKAGPDMAAAIREGRFDFQQYLDVIAGGSETVQSAADDTDDWREKLQLLKNKAMVALEPVANKVFGAITKAVEFVSGGIEVMVESFRTAGNDVTSAGGFLGVMVKVGMYARDAVDQIVKWWPKIKETFVNVFNAVAPVIQSIISWLGDTIPKVVDFFREHVEFLIPVLAVVAGAFIAQAVAATSAALATAAAIAPYVLIAAAIGALVAGIIYAWRNWEWFRDAVNAVKEWVVNDLWPALTAAWEGIKTAAVAVADAAVWAWVNVLQPAFVWVRDFVVNDLWPALQTAWDGISTGVSALISGVEWAITNVFVPAWNLVSATVELAWQLLQPVIDAIATYIKVNIDIISWAISNVFVPAANLIWSAMQYAWQIAKPIVDAIGTGIGFMISGVEWAITNVFKPAVEGITTFVQAVSDNVSPIVDGIGGFFSGLADTIEGAFSAMVSGVKSVWNTLASAWNDTVGGFHIPGFHIPGTSIGFDGFDVPNIPTFHTGGIVPGRTGEEVLAILQAGEQVTPIDQVGKTRDAPLIGTVIVQDGQSFARETMLLEALWGSAA